MRHRRRELRSDIGWTALAVVSAVAATSVALDYPRLGPVWMPEVHAVPTRCSLPRTLDEAHQVLARFLSPGLLDELRASSDQDWEATARVLGRELRNIWGLWNGSPLRDHLRARGLRHPDDMADLILITFVRHLKGRRLAVDEEVARLRGGAPRPMPSCPPCIRGGRCRTVQILDERLGRDRGFLIFDCCCGLRPYILEGVLRVARSTGDAFVVPSSAHSRYAASCRYLRNGAAE